MRRTQNVYDTYHIWTFEQLRDDHHHADSLVGKLDLPDELLFLFAQETKR